MKFDEVIKKQDYKTWMRMNVAAVYAYALIAKVTSSNQLMVRLAKHSISEVVSPLRVCRHG